MDSTIVLATASLAAMDPAISNDSPEQRVKAGGIKEVILPEQYDGRRHHQLLYLAKTIPHGVKLSVIARVSPWATK